LKINEEGKKKVRERKRRERERERERFSLVSDVKTQDCIGLSKSHTLSSY
jgi:hypothetical protein